MIDYSALWGLLVAMSPFVGLLIYFCLEDLFFPLPPEAPRDPARPLPEWGPPSETRYEFLDPQ